ncbi:MAG: mechanosensitive ion channel family protein [Bacteroidetes bacterium]|nr:mechanosensitive ion channel family protein [Bacteroidota bacterium]
MPDFSFLKQPLWYATTGDYLAFAAILLLTFFLKKPVSRLLARLSSGLAIRQSGSKYRGLYRSLIRKPLEWLFFVIVLFYAFNFIEEPLHRITLLRWHSKGNREVLHASALLDKLFVFFGIIFFILLLSRLLDFIYRSQAERARIQMQRARAQVLPLLRDVLKIVLWVIGFFWMLGSVFGVNIPALITGLGIGGVALALAAKETIENFLAAFTILADKSFGLDDNIRLGALEGRVERIGFRSTRLRSADGTLFIIPNKKLVDENLENLSTEGQLTVRLSLPLKYSIPPFQIDELLARLKSNISMEAEVLNKPDVTVDSYTENAFVLLISYTLPGNLSLAEQKQIKSAIAARAYVEITAAQS